MNRREFITTAAGVSILGVSSGVEKTEAAPAPVIYCTDGKEPKLIYDITTGNYFGHRCYSQVYFYESEMPPVGNRAELVDLMRGRAEYEEWWNKKNPPDRPCYEWEDCDYKFDLEKMKSLLDINSKPFVWFAWRRKDEISLIFAGHAPNRFEYGKGTVNDQAWKVYVEGDPAKLWLDEKWHNVKCGGVTIWSNPQYPITQWVKRVEKHIPSG